MKTECPQDDNDDGLDYNYDKRIRLREERVDAVAAPWERTISKSFGEEDRRSINIGLIK